MADLIVPLENADAVNPAGPATLGQLLAEVRDALGKNNIQWQQSPTTKINDWLQKLANLHNWNWRQEYVELGTTADQTYVALPDNFAKLRWATIKPRALPMMSVTWSRILECRSTVAMIAQAGYQFAIRYGVQASAGVAPTAVMELWPTPADTEAAVFALAYDRLIPVLSDNSDVPDVPIVHHPLVRQFIRAEALRYDNQREDWALERDELARMVADHMAIDGQLQQGGSPIRGAVHLGRGVAYMPHNRIGFQ